MNEEIRKNVLIVGNSASVYSLAKRLSELEEISEVFVAPGNSSMKEFSTIVDIREANVEELLEFVLENAVDLTIVFSEKAIQNDIASLFQQNNQMVFAPTQSSANICLNKSSGKKFMYKTRIPCPKFGIYDKLSMAIDYIKKSNMPVVIKTDEHQPGGVLICNTFSAAKEFVETLFDRGEKKVIIEDYVFGHEFSFYVITDGYHALPLGTVATYKYELEGNGGNLTDGMGCFAPDYKITKQIEQKIMGQIIYPTLNTLAKQQTPYVGILGVDLVLGQNDHLYTIEFNPFLKTPDTQCVLANLDEDIYKLFEACVVGSFADDYEQIGIADSSAISCTVLSKKENQVIGGLDDLDDDTSVAHFNTFKNQYLEYETPIGKTLVLTRKARVLSRAVEDLYEELSVINFDGMRYRKDIGKVY